MTMKDEDRYRALMGLPSSQSSYDGPLVVLFISVALAVFLYFFLTW